MVPCIKQTSLTPPPQALICIAIWLKQNTNLVNITECRIYIKINKSNKLNHVCKDGAEVPLSSELNRSFLQQVG